MKNLPMGMLALLALAGGCIELNKELTLRSDGSGTIEVRYRIPERTVSQVSGLVKLSRELAEAGGTEDPLRDSDYLVLLLNPSEDRIRTRMPAYADSGLTLSDVSVRARDAGREVRLTLAFQDIHALRDTDFFAEHGFHLSKLPDGNYQLARRVATEGAVVEPMTPEIVRMVTPFLGGFKAEITVKPPGRILRTNADRNGTAEVSWLYEFDRDPAAFRDFHVADMTLVFEGESLQLTGR